MGRRRRHSSFCKVDCTPAATAPHPTPFGKFESHQGHKSGTDESAHLPNSCWNEVGQCLDSATSPGMTSDAMSISGSCDGPSRTPSVSVSFSVISTPHDCISLSSAHSPSPGSPVSPENGVSRDFCFITCSNKFVLPSGPAAFLLHDGSNSAPPLPLSPTIDTPGVPGSRDSRAAAEPAFGNQVDGLAKNRSLCAAPDGNGLALRPCLSQIQQHDFLASQSNQPKQHVDIISRQQRGRNQDKAQGAANFGNSPVVSGPDNTAPFSNSEAIISEPGFNHYHHHHHHQKLGPLVEGVSYATPSSQSSSLALTSAPWGFLGSALTQVMDILMPPSAAFNSRADENSRVENGGAEEESVDTGAKASMMMKRRVRFEDDITEELSAYDRATRPVEGLDAYCANMGLSFRH